MVQIPPPDTGWTFFHIDLLSNFHCLFEKTENKWKRAENGPFKKIVGHLSTLPPLIAWLRWHTLIYSNLGLHIYISVGSFPINRSIDGCAQYNANPFIPRTWKDASRLTSRVILIHCSGYCLKVAHLLILAQSNAKYFVTLCVLNRSWKHRYPVWPDWAIYWSLGNFLKPLAAINLPKSHTFLGIFCKSVKIYFISSEVIFGQLLYTFGNFFSGHTVGIKAIKHFA